jgi:hypothetical protein
MLSWRPGAAACVVLAAAGYPDTPRHGDPIMGLENVDQPGVLVFHAGTAWEQGQIVTAGGRVLGVTGTGRTLEHALELAYATVEMISFSGMQYRHDIGVSSAAAQGESTAMITLINGASGEQAGTISEAQLQFLANNLEEEWSGDTDYYFNQATLEYLRERGADQELLDLLGRALAASGEADLRWSKS